MPRASAQVISARLVFPATVIVLLVLALTPLRFTRWVSWFGNLATMLVAPVSAPVASLARWIDPGSRAHHAQTDEAYRALNDDRQRWEILYRQELDRTRRLEQLVTQLQRGIEHTSDLAVVPLAASVIGGSSDPSSPLLQVRAGARQGVDPNTVAAVEGIHLLGRVVRAADRLSWVKPITAPDASGLTGVVVRGESNDGVECFLRATGQGTLRGPMAYAPGAEGSRPIVAKPGDEVRLKDPTWPPSAQWLIVGVVESVAPSPQNPLQQIITVRPVPNLQRISEVVLRIPIAAEETRAAGTQEAPR